MHHLLVLLKRGRVALARKLLGRQFIFLWLSFAMAALASCYTDRSLIVTEETRKVSCLTHAYFVQNLCDDELEYLAWAENLKRYPAIADLTPEVLSTLTRETSDIDKTSALFYNRLLRDSTNHELFSFVEMKESELQQTKALPSYPDFTLIAVPGMFYKDNPETGADGSGLRALAQKLHMKDGIFEIQQTGTVEANGRAICDYLSTTSHTKIILAAASKGGSDIAYAMQLCGNSPEMKKVVGWLNIGGITKGSLLINHIDSTWRFRMEAKTYFCLNGYNYEGLKSIRKSADSPLNAPLVIPNSVTVVNIMGVPLFRTVTERAKPFYLQLAQYGPNDGISILTDVYMPGHANYASWRNDHYFRWPMSEEKMLSFLIYIAEKNM